MHVLPAVLQPTQQCVQRLAGPTATTATYGRKLVRSGSTYVSNMKANAVSVFLGFFVRFRKLT